MHINNDKKFNWLYLCYVEISNVVCTKQFACDNIKVIMYRYSIGCIFKYHKCVKYYLYIYISITVNKRFLYLKGFNGMQLYALQYVFFCTIITLVTTVTIGAITMSISVGLVNSASSSVMTVWMLIGIAIIIFTV